MTSYFNYELLEILPFNGMSTSCMILFFSCVPVHHHIDKPLTCSLTYLYTPTYTHPSRAPSHTHTLDVHPHIHTLLTCTLTYLYTPTYIHPSRAPSHTHTLDVHPHIHTVLTCTLTYLYILTYIQS